MTTNKKQDCTFTVPKNEFGITAMHCFDNQKFDDHDLEKVLAGPVAAVESAYQEELAKVITVGPGESPVNR